MIAFIDDHRAAYGVASICRVLQIAPSVTRQVIACNHRKGGYYAQLTVRADPTKASARQHRDASLRPKLQKVWDDNWKVYGVRKAWRQLCREGEAGARCTVARLMAGMGLRGIVRGKAMKTTIPDTLAPCPRDKVNRQFRASAPNMLWVSDFTYVSTWEGVACVVDTFANRIVGWKVSRSPKTVFVLPSRQICLANREPGNGCAGTGTICPPPSP